MWKTAGPFKTKHYFSNPKSNNKELAVQIAAMAIRSRDDELKNSLLNILPKWFFTNNAVFNNYFFAKNWVLLIFFGFDLASINGKIDVLLLKFQVWRENDWPSRCWLKHLTPSFFGEDVKLGLPCPLLEIRPFWPFAG